MNLSKSIFTILFLTFFFGVFSANAQSNKKASTLTKIRVPQEAKIAITKYLKATQPKDKVVTKALQSFKPSSTLGFNIGMPPSKNFILIIIPSSQVITKPARLPYDVLGGSSELVKALSGKGIFPSRNFSFLMDIRTNTIVSYKDWARKVKQ